MMASLTRILLIGCWSVICVVPVGATQIRTYEFIANNASPLYRNSGLLGRVFHSNLQGQFDVEFESQAKLARITRFDVVLSNVIQPDFPQSGFRQDFRGANAKQVLFNDPVGLTGVVGVNGAITMWSGFLVMLFNGDNYTSIRIDDFFAAKSNLSIYSTSTIAGENINTQEPFLSVQLVAVVPEPSSWPLVIVCLASTLCFRGWNQRVTL